MDAYSTPVLPGCLQDAEHVDANGNSWQQRPPAGAGSGNIATRASGAPLPHGRSSFHDALGQLLHAHEVEVSELHLELARLRSCLKDSDCCTDRCLARIDGCSQAFEHATHQVENLPQSGSQTNREGWCAPLPGEQDQPKAKSKTRSITLATDFTRIDACTPPPLTDEGGEVEKAADLTENGGRQSLKSLDSSLQERAKSTVSFSEIGSADPHYLSDPDYESGPEHRSGNEHARESVASHIMRPTIVGDSMRRSTLLMQIQIDGFEGEDWLLKWISLLNHLYHYAMQNTSHLHEIWVVSESYLHKVAACNDNVDLWGKACDRRRAIRRGRARALSQVGTLRMSVGSIRVTDVFFERQYVWTELKFRWSLIRQAGWQAFVEDYLVMAPHARFRLAWVFTGVSLMFYDVIVLPLQAFDYAEDDGDTNFMKWFQAIFWTCDFFITFCTAVYIDVEVVTNLSVIALNYAKGWMLFDLGVLVPIWIEQVLSRGTHLGAAKLVRMLRFLRLVRLAKLELLLGESLKAVNSPSLILLFKLVQLILGLIVFIHVNACMWYLVGKRPEGWTTQVENADTSYKYLTSVHWALTQFQGTSEIYPGSTGERAYAVGCVMVSMIMAAAFISNFTNIVMQLQALTVDRDRQIHDLCLFMNANRIPRPLSMRVRTYLLWKSQKEKHRACDALKCLPSGLVMELEFEVYQPVLLNHDFMGEFINVYPRLSRRVFHEAMKPHYISPSDLVFSAQESCFSVYFVVGGTLDYAVIIRRQHEALTLGRELVAGGTTLSEPALWMHWQHRGTLVAETYSHLMSLSSEIWRKTVSTHPPALLSCNLYARRLIAGMARQYWKCSDILNPAQLIVEEKSFLDCLVAVVVADKKKKNYDAFDPDDEQ